MFADLLAQARTLAALDPNRPKQANLRRAVSSAYYALFHFLVEESGKAFFGSDQTRRPMRSAIGRAFDHATMKEACVAFAAGNLKMSITKHFPAPFTIPAELR